MAASVSHRDMYAAVGYALTCWEQMELQLAGLYTILVSNAYSIEALAGFGTENRRFVDRMAAIARAAQAYSVGRPDQHIEELIANFIARATDLSIERHRIAHGVLVVTPTAEVDEAENITIYPDQPVYWLGAPWYSILSLRWALVGMQTHTIKAHAAEFLRLMSDVADLNRRLWPQEPPSSFSRLTTLPEEP